MTRLRLCAFAVALTAGHCLADPTAMESAVRSFGVVGSLQNNEASPEADSVKTPTTSTTTAASPNSSYRALPGNYKKWWGSFMKAIEKQFQVQESMAKQIFKYALNHLGNVRGQTYDSTNSSAFARVNEMMDMISTRLTTVRENAAELMANRESLGEEALQNVTTKFMKEVRVQDVVVDALWASLRAMQINAFVSGTTVAEDRDAEAAANQAAEEFLTLMYHNLRAAGMSENDVAKFVPKVGAGHSQHRRSMAAGDRWSGFYGDSSYPNYGPEWGYPRYGSGYGYTSHGFGGWGSPTHGYYASRYLNVDCPGCSVLSMTSEQMFEPPFRSPGKTMGMGYNTPIMGRTNTSPMMSHHGTPPTMGQRLTPARPTGMTTGFPRTGNMNNPLGAAGPYATTVSASGYSSPPEMVRGSYSGFRRLAPVEETPGFSPEIEIPNPIGGFEPTGGMPF